MGKKKKKNKNLGSVTPENNTKPKKKMTRKEKKAEREKLYSFSTYPHLMALKPKESYVFHSDYIKVDNKYMTIMGFFHKDNANDSFGPFWGIMKIPTGLGDDVVITVLEQTKRMSEGWINSHQSKSEQISGMNESSQAKDGTNTTKQKAMNISTDLEIIANELINGASYLHVHSRLLVKANSLESLDHAVDQITRLYVDRFGTLNVDSYPGEQRRELKTLFGFNDSKLGKGEYFTSVEYAGSYNLVTHGLDDFDGEYVGVMTGDVNNSAVLFDVDGYKHHIVVANENYNEKLGRVLVSDMWGSKVSQSCMVNNGRVVHLILNNCNLDKLGPKFDNLTYKIDMNSGDVNMFEVFGDVKDELSLYATQMTKLKLMAEQTYATSDHDKAIIEGYLEEILTTFYVEQGLWRYNAQENRDKLRLVGIPHDQVPKLDYFISYLETEYKSIVNASAKDEEKLHAINVIRATFKNMLSNNGDLFNTYTSDEIDGINTGVRVIYDFSKLSARGTGVAMAQLVNVMSFAVQSLGLGDTLIIHGTQKIDNAIKKYITSQLDLLYEKGGRVCFLYDKVEAMLNDQDFNEFDKADYTILGNMTPNVVNKYQKLLGQEIPPSLSQTIASKGDDVCYIRRGFDNVVFNLDLLLGIKKNKKKKKNKGRG